MTLTSQPNLFLQVSYTKQNAPRIQRTLHEQLEIYVVQRERIFQSIHTDFMLNVSDLSEKSDFIVCLLAYSTS